ncbi:Rhodanese-like protein [Auriscalpium vulgare]|uniref:Rhodanese-like protein n=1 Tax=Auriscalpium vulgare TaxID=40419 RepID=A0ACB8RZ62_9AGAM|nr:Rhodanese-like protein [Auriscalpium vulgare]
MTTRYITPDELEALIKSDKQPRKDYLVIDVRDDDHAGGHILHSHHSPSRTFHDNVDKLAHSTKDVHTVVFHCALSQARGPKAARMYAAIRDEQGDTKPHEVLILRGGFTDFQANFSSATTCNDLQDDPLLVANWDPDVWAAEWS